MGFHKAALRGSRLRQKLRWAKEVHGGPVVWDGMGESVVAKIEGASKEAWGGYVIYQ